MKKKVWNTAGGGVGFFSNMSKALGSSLSIGENKKLEREDGLEEERGLLGAWGLLLPCAK